MSTASKVVAVVASASDANARHVAAALERRGGTPLLVETDRVPENTRLSWLDGVIRYDGIPLGDLGAFYIKAVYVSMPVIDPLEMPHRNFRRWQDQYIAERERQSFLCSILRDLGRGGRTVVNPVESFDLHFLKLYQLSLLRANGFPVPPTLASCDPEVVEEFVQAHPSVIFKPLAGGAHVQLVGPEDLSPERLSLLRNSPVLFQAQIPGDEFRVYVLDGEPVAAYQIPTEGVVDAREALDHCFETTLPQEAWDLCIRAAELLHLVFTAVDLRRTPDGDFILLELNPAPAILFHEDPEHPRVTNRLADFLLAHA